VKKTTKQLLRESIKSKLILERELLIINNFNKEFNKIKRLTENELKTLVNYEYIL
jgi:hypothetical protein